MDWDTWNQQYGREQIQKWRSAIDLRTATDSEIQAYTSAKLYEYMECNREGYGYDSWFFFYEDFSYFTAKDFNQLGQYHLKELRKQLKEEYCPPSTKGDVEFECFIATFESAIDALEAPAIEAPAIEAPAIEAPAIEAPVIEAPVIEAPAIEAPAIEAPVIEAPAIEAPAIEALPIKALPVDTNTNEPLNTNSLTFEALPVETDEPAIPSANTTEPSVGDTSTFIIDYYFAGSSIPRSLSTTTLIPPQSIPPNSYLAYTLTSTNTFTKFGFQALQRIGVG
jgi:hypothetical protein